MKTLKINDVETEYEYTRSETGLTVRVAGEEYYFSNAELEKSYVYDDKFNDHRAVYIPGAEAIIKGDQLERSKSSAMEEGSLVSPMPGKIFKVYKNAGEEVVKGDTILILEAMKMEHPIKANCDGTIKEIFFNQGALVQGGSLLVEMEEA